MCKSPSAAEAKALCDGEDEINAVRYQLAEMLGLDSPGDDKDEICAKIPAVLATDSKNTYDNMGKIAAFLNSKEKMVGVDLAKLQESCARTDLKIRWVNGDAQLANSLTKSHKEFVQLNNKIEGNEGHSVQQARSASQGRTKENSNCEPQ